jgi:ABC-type transporter Mla subunit MlaD
MANYPTPDSGNGWLVLAAVLAVSAVVVVVVLFFGIGGDTGGTSSY